MNLLDTALINLLNPGIMCFILGILAVIVKSNLSLPETAYNTIAIYLLLAIGIKGGIKLSGSSFKEFIQPALATIAIAFITTFVAYCLLKFIGKVDFINSIAIAAHHGSVSVVTFMAAVNFLQILSIEYEPFMTALVAILEIPSILIALSMVFMRNSKEEGLGIVEIFRALRKALTTKSIILLVGGLAIGMIMDSAHYPEMKTFFENPFKGVLCIFLLQMGIIAANKIADIRKVGKFLVIFNLIIPIPFAYVGIILGKYTGLSLGGATLLGVMSASSSYIAVPAAMKASLPEASSSLPLISTLGINVPFNIIFGITIYYKLAQYIYGM
jgi:hypothetical protein